MLNIGMRIFYGRFAEPGDIIGLDHGIFRVHLDTGREISATSHQLATIHPDALRAALENARSEGATHYTQPDNYCIFAYRPAPAYPGNYGQKCYIFRGNVAHTGEPWILAGELPTLYPVHKL